MKTFISTSVLAAFFIFPYSAATIEEVKNNNFHQEYETAYKLVQSQYKM